MAAATFTASLLPCPLKKSGEIKRANRLSSWGVLLMLPQRHCECDTLGISAEFSLFFLIVFLIIFFCSGRSVWHCGEQKKMNKIKIKKKTPF